MKTRNIEHIFTPDSYHYVGNGFRVHNFIPASGTLPMQRMNPFVMMDYNSSFYFPPTSDAKGVGPHPHRGFETVTIVYKGKVAHHDSSGNKGVIGEGEVQWMTAASGILHQEYHEEDFSKSGGNVHMVQLWVNLPARHKKSDPKYQDISNANIGRYELTNGRGIIEVIAGNFRDVKGPAFTFTPINLFNAKLREGTTESFSFPVDYNTALLVIEGSIRVNGIEKISTDSFVLFENNGTSFHITALKNSIVLILSGEPINEPIISQGPFVMNSREELTQAFSDYNNGRFGYMPEH